MAANRTIKVDLWNKIRERITVVQREVLGRSLTFQLYSGATPINLTGGSVTFYAILPDTTTEVFNALTLTTPASGICTYTFTEATIVQAGNLRCWLVFVDASANELRTQEFAIEVQASPDFTSSVEGTSEYTALEAALAAASGFKLLCWPVGSVYIGVGSTSPATLFGGTWSVFGAGKVLVGIDSTDADFDTVEETRGAKTHALTANENGTHTHTTTDVRNVVTYDGTTGTASGTVGGAPLNISSLANSGLGTAHNNIQPSIVVRMWKRTA